MELKPAAADKGSTRYRVPDEYVSGLGVFIILAVFVFMWLA